jgi:hypothetical protein
MQMEGVIATMDGVGAMAEAIADDMAHEPHGDSFFLTGGGRETTQVDEDVMLAEEVSVPPSLANTSRLILRFLACWAPAALAFRLNACPTAGSTTPTAPHCL